MIQIFLDLRRRAPAFGPKRVAVVMADDAVALSAALKAVVFVSASSADTAAATAVSLCRKGEADILLKGHLRTDQLLHAVLNIFSFLRFSRLDFLKFAKEGSPRDLSHSNKLL